MPLSFILGRADTLRQNTEQAQQGLRGRLRIGLGSGPGALLTTPLLLRMAQHTPQVQLHISRGSTDLLVQALRAPGIPGLSATPPPFWL